MRSIKLLYVFLVVSFASACSVSTNSSKNNYDFAPEMTKFIPSPGNPVFSGTGVDTWDQCIRERGFILFDEGIYKMWYSGYNPAVGEQKYLGYATSPNGISWTRYPGNPIFDKKWTEDMFVMKEGGTYYMYAEGKDDIAHMLVSPDGIHWEEKGDLAIFTTEGDKVPPPYGTPTIWIENGQWYLFYERNDQAVWLAKSNDQITWTNVQDEPVLKPGPEKYDIAAIAVNQIIQRGSDYYLFYHSTSSFNWQNSDTEEIWTSSVAKSGDLLHWKKYPGNPIVDGNHSSPIVVFDGEKPSLYTMHPNVCRYYAIK